MDGLDIADRALFHRHRDNLAAMTLWQVASPTVERRGPPPMMTTRGHRLVIGLLGSAYIHLGWIGLND